MRFLLLLLCACRFSWSTHQGTPPRVSNDIKLALHAVDEMARVTSRSVLNQDPHVTVVDIDPAALAPAKERCGNATCPHVHAAACAWAAQQGADYYAVATVEAQFSSKFECTQTRGSLLDPKDDECVAGKTTGEHTTATYSHDVYDARTCEQVRAMSRRISESASGAEEQSKPEALAQLAQRVRTKLPPLPDQIVVDGLGRAAAPDGLYAMYRDDEYSGYVRAKRGVLEPLHCCATPTLGDVLVARGTRKTLELAVTGVYTGAGFGAGVHVRHYPLAGGLRFGVGADAFGRDDHSILLVTPEIGWGLRIHPAVQLSANLGLGAAIAWSSAVQDGPNARAAPQPHAIATLRAETYFATWAFLGVDAGYARTGTFDDWDNGTYSGGDFEVSAVIARLWLGFDL